MSSWDTESGGLFDEGEVTITKAKFAYDADYMDGEALVFVLEGTSDDSPQEGGAVRNLYSIGEGWETEDAKGKVVVGNDKFHESSNYALFFKAALGTDAADIIKERGYPDDASIWDGLVFYMKRQEITRKFRDRDEEVVSRVVLPTKFIGEAKTSKKKGGGKKKAASSSNGKAEKALTAKLKNLARKHDDHDDFLVAALEKFEDELEEFSDLMSSVMDEDGLWADVQG
jgi:hypothetical protein